MNQHSLNEEQQRIVVRALARYVSPSEIRKQVKRIWDIEISLPAILYYNPNRANGGNLRPELTALFYQERALAKATIDDLGVSDLAYRMRLYQRILDKYCIGDFEEDGSPIKNDDMVLRVCQQAAKEMGGAFTNKVRVGGELPDPQDEEKELADLLGLPVEALRRVGKSKPAEVEVETEAVSQPRRKSKAKKPSEEA